jgi:hypothetical protein
MRMLKPLVFSKLHDRTDINEEQKKNKYWYLVDARVMVGRTNKASFGKKKRREP